VVGQPGRPDKIEYLRNLDSDYVHAVGARQILLKIAFNALADLRLLS